MPDPVLQLRGVQKTYRQGETPLTVLADAELTVHAGELVALAGPSGSGKSTLLHIAGLLEVPDGGEVTVAGHAGSRLRDGARTRLRRSTIGFVYQHHHLLPEFSARENAAMPRLIAGESRRAARRRADTMLDRVGLADRATHRPGWLSGGEQQRVAIARALANEPRLLLADEPTGNLDPATADGVFDMLQDLARRHGMAAVVATHNRELAARMDRVLRLDGGAPADTEEPRA